PDPDPRGPEPPLPDDRDAPGPEHRGLDGAGAPRDLRPRPPRRPPGGRAARPRALLRPLRVRERRSRAVPEAPDRDGRGDVEARGHGRRAALGRVARPVLRP